MRSQVPVAKLLLTQALLSLLWRRFFCVQVMDSEDLLFILYTSGSTGKPKGVAHSTAGYLLYAAMTHKVREHARGLTSGKNVWNLLADSCCWWYWFGTICGSWCSTTKKATSMPVWLIVGGLRATLTLCMAPSSMVPPPSSSSPYLPTPTTSGEHGPPITSPLANMMT